MHEYRLYRWISDELHPTYFVSSNKRYLHKLGEKLYGEHEYDYEILKDRDNVTRDALITKFIKTLYQ